MSFNYSEPSFRIADIYKTVELEALDLNGTPIVLIRTVFPEGLKYAHLLPERSVPTTTMTLSEIVRKVDTYGHTIPVHFTEDDPFICGVEPLISHLLRGHKVYVNTSGLVNISPSILDSLSGLYLWTRPGLNLNRMYCDYAKEIRAYWKPGDEAYTDHVRALDETLPNFKGKMFLAPYDLRPETVKATLDKCLELGWRFGLRVSSAIPDADKHLQNVPEVENIFHERYYETRSAGKKK